MPRPSSARWLSFPPGLPEPDRETERVPLVLVLEREDGSVARYRTDVGAAWCFEFFAAEHCASGWESPGDGSAYYVVASGPRGIGASKLDRLALDRYLAQ